jgi:hypothetical protein
VEISNDHAAESPVSSFCGRDHYSSFQTCFEDLPARHASLNGMQKTVQNQSIRGNFGFSFNAISYNSVRGVGRMKRLHTGVTLPQCIAGAGSWREADERCAHDEDSSNVIFCY